MPPGLVVSYRRTGGVAGVDLAAEVGDDLLDEAEAGIARQLLEQAPAVAPVAGHPGAADLVSHRLTLTDGAQRATFEWTEPQVPDGVRPLLAALRRRAVPVPPE